MNIFLVRHGQSRGNASPSEYFEKLDCEIELTEKGKSDAVSAADSILNIVDHFNHLGTYLNTNNNIFDLYCSTYKRAIQTANILHGRLTGFEGYEINKFEDTPIIREREWGGLRDIVELGKKTEEHFNFYYRPTGGESFADCYQRAMIFHQHLMTNSKCENNIIVAHGEFNKLYMMYLLGWSVTEFNMYKSPKNGEVFLINTDTGLSSLTPLTRKFIKH